MQSICSLLQYRYLVSKTQDMFIWHKYNYKSLPCSQTRWWRVSPELWTTGPRKSVTRGQTWKQKRDLFHTLWKPCDCWEAQTPNLCLFLEMRVSLGQAPNGCLISRCLCTVIQRPKEGISLFLTGNKLKITKRCVQLELIGYKWHSFE